MTNRRPIVSMLGVILFFALPTSPLRAQSPSTLPLAPLRDVTITTTEGTWIALDVSPDGRTIVFEILGNIFRLPITGGRARQLTEGPAFNQRPKFSPDGQHIVFTSDQGGYNQLWRMPAGGGVSELVPARDTAGYVLVTEAANVTALFGFGDSARFDAASTYRAPGGRYEIRKWSVQQPPPKEFRDCIARDFVLTDWATGVERRLAPAGADCGVENHPPIRIHAGRPRVHHVAQRQALAHRVAEWGDNRDSVSRGRASAHSADRPRARSCARGLARARATSRRGKTLTRSIEGGVQCIQPNLDRADAASRSGSDGERLGAARACAEASDVARRGRVLAGMVAGRTVHRVRDVDGFRRRGWRDLPDARRREWKARASDA